MERAKLRRQRSDEIGKKQKMINPNQLKFTCSNSTIETLEESEICSKFWCFYC